MKSNSKTPNPLTQKHFNDYSFEERTTIYFDALSKNESNKKHNETNNDIHSASKLLEILRE
jgi:hypothetical protein